MSAWEPMWSRVLDANPITDAIALDLDYRNDRYRALDSGILVEKPWGDIVNNYSAPAGRYYFDATRNLVSAASNTPIRAFDPATEEFLGNQIFGSTTGLNHYSFDTTSSAWTVTGATRTPYGGSLGGFTPVYVESAGQTWHRLTAGFDGGTANLTGYSSYLFKCVYGAGTSGRVELVFRDTSISSQSVVNGPVAGSKSVTNQLAGTITLLYDRAIGLGLREIALVCQPGNVNGLFSFSLGPNTATVGANVLFCGGCVYGGVSSDRPWVKTTNGPALITAENQIIDGGAFSDIGGSSPNLTVVAKVRVPNPGGTRPFYQFYADDSNRWNAILTSGGVSTFGTNGLASPNTQWSSSQTLVATGAAELIHSVATVSAAGVQHAVNGILSSGLVGAVSPPITTSLRIGAGGSGNASHINGYIERLTIFSRPLPRSVTQRIAA